MSNCTCSKFTTNNTQNSISQIIPSLMMAPYGGPPCLSDLEPTIEFMFIVGRPFRQRHHSTTAPGNVHEQHSEASSLDEDPQNDDPSSRLQDSAVGLYADTHGVPHLNEDLCFAPEEEEAWRRRQTPSPTVNIEYYEPSRVLSALPLRPAPAPLDERVGGRRNNNQGNRLGVETRMPTGYRSNTNPTKLYQLDAIDGDDPEDAESPEGDQSAFADEISREDRPSLSNGQSVATTSRLGGSYYVPSGAPDHLYSSSSSHQHNHSTTARDTNTHPTTASATSLPEITRPDTPHPEAGLLLPSTVTLHQGHRPYTYRQPLAPPDTTQNTFFSGYHTPSTPRPDSTHPEVLTPSPPHPPSSPLPCFRFISTPSVRPRSQLLLSLRYTYNRHCFLPLRAHEMDPTQVDRIDCLRGRGNIDAPPGFEQQGGRRGSVLPTFVHQVGWYEEVDTEDSGRSRIEETQRNDVKSVDGDGDSVLDRDREDSDSDDDDLHEQNFTATRQVDWPDDVY